MLWSKDLNKKYYKEAASNLRSPPLFTVLPPTPCISTQTIDGYWSKGSFLSFSDHHWRIHAREVRPFERGLRMK
jgi:hypothetical protein